MRIHTPEEQQVKEMDVTSSFHTVIPVSCVIYGTTVSMVKLFKQNPPAFLFRGKSARGIQISFNDFTNL